MRHRAAALMILVFFCSLLLAQQRKEPAVARSTVNRPAKVAFRQNLLKRLQVPEDFEINIFASGTGNPRMMAVGPDGSVYVTRPKQNDLIRLHDKNGDGKSDEIKAIVSGIELLHGIEIREGKLYLAGVKEVHVTDLNGQNRQRLIGNLPDGGQHPNRTIGFGPDGMLYISIGSTCNSCDEANPEHAAMLVTNPDGSGRKVFATGLRNTIGFDWHPATKEFWGMDHGSDGLGDNTPGEELNRLRQGSDYGWPYCYANKTPDPFTKPPEGTNKEAYCQKTAPPDLTYQAHSAPIAMVFYNARQFPDDFKGDAFVAMHGSWNRSTPTGYKVVRVHFENGKPQRFEDFVTGFLLNSREQFGRPAGLAVVKDGSLLISDDANGVIYRVSYKPKISQAVSDHTRLISNFTRKLFLSDFKSSIRIDTFQGFPSLSEKLHIVVSGSC